MWRAYISGDEQDDAMAVEELAGRLSALWASSRLANVGNHTILPASIFVPEDAQRASPTAADCPFGDDAAQRPSPSGIGAISITSSPSGTLTASAEW